VTNNGIAILEPKKKRNPNLCRFFSCVKKLSAQSKWQGLTALPKSPHPKHIFNPLSTLWVNIRICHGKYELHSAAKI